MRQDHSGQGLSREIILQILRWRRFSQRGEQGEDEFGVCSDGPGQTALAGVAVQPACSGTNLCPRLLCSEEIIQVDGGLLSHKKYRKFSREILSSSGVGVVFVYLKGSKQMIEDRLLSRENHYFKASMIQTQFQALEVSECRSSELFKNLSS